MQTGGGSGSQEPSLGTLESLPHALLEPSLSPALGLSWSGRQRGGVESQKGWGGKDEVVGGGTRVDQSRVHACPGSWREAVRAGREGCTGGRPGSPHRALVGRVHGRVLGAMEGPAELFELGHATQHPRERPTECRSRGHQTPAVLSHPTAPPFAPLPHASRPTDTRRDEAQAARGRGGGWTCSAQVRACRSAPAGIWTATAA